MTGGVSKRGTRAGAFFGIYGESAVFTSPGFLRIEAGCGSDGAVETSIGEGEGCTVSLVFGGGALLICVKIKFALHSIMNKRAVEFLTNMGSKFFINLKTLDDMNFYLYFFVGIKRFQQ